MFNEIHRVLVRSVETVTPATFEQVALNIFGYQSIFNPLYSEYLSLINVDTGNVEGINDIPFLPIQLFKNFDIRTKEWSPQATFTSSGTTGQQTSQHHVRNRYFYEKNTRRGFEQFYGNINDYCVLALLPSYLERSGSSLVAMVDFFIRQSKYPQSGFFLKNTDELRRILRKNQAQNIPTLLIGVSFALLDLAEQGAEDLSNITIMETGGMKGRRKEITRSELHNTFRKAFNVKVIHSEYGMTELLSQAYSQGEFFRAAATMRVSARDITDPLSPIPNGRTGGLNIIDLANLDTCAFIATEDLGRVYENGDFEVLGRLDNSDMRGCNLMLL